MHPFPPLALPWRNTSNCSQSAETTPYDITSTIRCFLAHSNHALTSAVTVFLPFALLLQELINRPVEHPCAIALSLQSEQKFFKRRL
ncbi:MAG: hypothetical protein RMY28_013830 [Nostoc sp. ChiSLP01]